MAAGLAAELKESLGARPSWCAAAEGSSSVKVDGEVVFDKKATGRFPILGELSEILEERGR